MNTCETDATLTRLSDQMGTVRWGMRHACCCRYVPVACESPHSVCPVSCVRVRVVSRRLDSGVSGAVCARLVPPTMVASWYLVHCSETVEIKIGSAIILWGSGPDARRRCSFARPCVSSRRFSSVVGISRTALAARRARGRLPQDRPARALPGSLCSR